MHVTLGCPWCQVHELYGSEQLVRVSIAAQLINKSGMFATSLSSVSYKQHMVGRGLGSSEALPMVQCESLSMVQCIVVLQV